MWLRWGEITKARGDGGQLLIRAPKNTCDEWIFFSPTFCWKLTRNKTNIRSWMKIRNWMMTTKSSRASRIVYSVYILSRTNTAKTSFLQIGLCGQLLRPQTSFPVRNCLDLKFLSRQREPRIVAHKLRPVFARFQAQSAVFTSSWDYDK